jgi:uncharacterized protein (DUF4415 family)/uncharacterized DUF497 family protein
VQFEWDAIKAVANRRKHGVSFEVAARVFDDPACCRPWIDDTARSAGTVSAQSEKQSYMSRTQSKTKSKRVRPSASSQPGKLVRVNAENIKLTPAMLSELATMANRRNGEIDFSDAPEVKDFRGAVRGRFYRPLKKAISIRLDADVLTWIQSKGGPYQTRINAILRQVMEQSISKR